MIENKQLTTNFHIREFKCKDGTEVPDIFYENVLSLAQNLQVLRDDLNENRPLKAPPEVVITLHVNSGYRTEEYNKKVGGKKFSRHLVAGGADLTCQWESPALLRARILRLIKHGKMEQGGVGRYPGFTHYDNRGIMARW